MLRRFTRIKEKSFEILIAVFLFRYQPTLLIVLVRFLADVSYASRRLIPSLFKNSFQILIRSPPYRPRNAVVTYLKFIQRRASGRRDDL